MLSGKSVMIVEDAALIAVDIEMMLGELGAAHVSTLGGGDNVVSRQRHFDLAIVDIRTAATVGSDLVASLDRDAVPVVFLSTDPDRNGVPEFTGRFETVPKPYTYEDLCSAIARLID